jgi:peroxiredoxin
LNKDKPFPFPLVSDTSLKVFKKYKAYDDFEKKKPLHGTFLIDRGGKIRWQDISFEPFTELQFLIKESKRLLAQEPPQVTRR